MTEQEPIPLATGTQIDADPPAAVGPDASAAGDPPKIAAERPAEIPVEEDAPMIDIHPVQHAPITRRDFFVHLFIVVLGILIAIGLEQGVEYIHHRRQLAEARRELAVEYKINLAVYRTQRAEANRFTPLLRRDLAILMYLRAHPGAPRSSWPGEFSWYHSLPQYVDAAWKSLQGTEILTLMPQAEVQRNTTLYSMLLYIDEDERSTNGFFTRSVGYGFRGQDPASMTPAQLDDAIQSASDVLGLYAEMTNLEINLNAQYGDFVPAPTYADQRKIMGLESPSHDLSEGLGLERQLRDEIARIQSEAEDTK